MQEFTVNDIVLVLETVVVVPLIVHLIFKFFDNGEDVVIENITVAVDPVPE